MSWKLAEAKQHFSELVRRAQHTPQRIQNRDTVVAAIVGSATFDEFLAWRDKQGNTISDMVDELQTITDASAYTLDVPARKDRDNAAQPSGSATSRTRLRSHVKKKR